MRMSARCLVLGPEYRTIVSPSPTSQLVAAACVSEQLFDMTGRRPGHRTNKLIMREERGHRASPTPNKSESPSPKARLVKSDTQRLTTHAK
jgi:hypothetical protein